MRVVRHPLPAGIAAVEFCHQHTVVVNSSLSESEGCAAAALARAQCDGVFVLVWEKELATYAPNARVRSSTAFRAI